MPTQFPERILTGRGQKTTVTTLAHSYIPTYKQAGRLRKGRSSIKNEGTIENESTIKNEGAINKMEATHKEWRLLTNNGGYIKNDKVGGWWLVTSGCRMYMEFTKNAILRCPSQLSTWPDHKRHTPAQQ